VLSGTGGENKMHISIPSSLHSSPTKPVISTSKSSHQGPSLSQHYNLYYPTVPNQTTDNNCPHISAI